MEMVIMAGVSGSGKTTLAKAEYAHLERVSLDKIYAGGETAMKALAGLWMPDNLPEPPNDRRKAEHVLIRRALESGRGVVIDDINLTKEIRRRHILHGRAYGCAIHAVSFLNVEKAKMRNMARTGISKNRSDVLDGEGKVPKQGFFRQLKEWESPVTEEGFVTVRAIVN